MLKRSFIILIVLALLSTEARGSVESSPRLGVWITVFSPEKVLHSRDNIDRLIFTCEKAGITDIYLQVYRADKAYYDSSITDRSAFDKIKAEAGEDTITYLISAAAASVIKVHAWLNLMSLAQNKEANVLKKYGNSVLTCDQNGRPSMSLEDKEFDSKRYVGENQLFLEPGDWRVREYMGNITEEVLKKYPGFYGVHLDYIRYPSVVPFIPGARFTSHGISYGYNKMNLLNFTKETGLDASKMEMTRDNASKWDGWRRSQVTRMVAHIAERIREIAPACEISATVVPSLDRTYLVTFQDWTNWIDSALVNSVIIMNYTSETPLFKLNSASCIAAGGKENVQIGVGSYILKDDPEALKEQLSAVRALSPSGVVLFSYDEVARNEKLQEFLAETFSGKDKRFKTID
jgi:uncharacterized lipoprotein YddW (UPF0748 family)